MPKKKQASADTAQPQTPAVQTNNDQDTAPLDAGPSKALCDRPSFVVKNDGQLDEDKDDGDKEAEIGDTDMTSDDGPI